MPTTHTIVIGAGIMGLSCAWRLARQGVSVDLLDGRRCGNGATLAALGALWPPSPLVNGPLQQLHRASLWEFESFIAELQTASGQQIPFARRGRIELLNSDKAVIRAVEEAAVAVGDWPQFGKDKPVMEVLDPARLAAEFPAIAADGRAALLCRATAQVRVAELVAALRAACLAAGVRIAEGRAVRGLVIEGAKVTGVRMENGSGEEILKPQNVLVTAGTWSGLVAPEIANIAPVRPAKGQGIALRVPSTLQVESIVKSEKIYLVPWDGETRGNDAGGREILVGSTTEPEAGFNEEPTDKARTLLLDGATALVPALKGAAILRQWAGLRPENPAKKHPPIMGVHPDVENLYVCTGHFKTGIGLSARVSTLMAGLIIGGEVSELEGFMPR
jgi:glycine oxidase